jgi:hypothetical protein
MHKREFFGRNRYQLLASKSQLSELFLLATAILYLCRLNSPADSLENTAAGEVSPPMLYQMSHRYRWQAILQEVGELLRDGSRGISNSKDGRNSQGIHEPSEPFFAPRPTDCLRDVTVEH